MLRSLPTDLDVDIRRDELQFTPGQRHNTTWISRMEVWQVSVVIKLIKYIQLFQSVKAAVETQLAELARTQPNKRACLVTFSDDVSDCHA